ncbi:MAG: M14 family zinc carboxypeptidase [Gemmatimonadota bacterium]
MFRPAVVAVAVLLACSPPRVVVTNTPRATASATIADGLAIADRYRVSAVNSRRIRHAEYWRAIGPSLQSNRLRVAEAGRSIQGREIRSITFGSGSVDVMLWSQMHGDESTATMALADVLAWMAGPGDDDVRSRVSSALTVTIVPMLNPDGAELFQRENALGVDINRDARQLSTPEARILRSLHERLQPDFGFNLHDQNARTRVGRDGLQAGIALLAPAADAERSWGPLRVRARLVAAGLARAFASEIPGRVAKYDDAFNPRAFGDLMAAWGTSTVLIESGALPDDPDKQKLRRLNAAALVVALDAIASRSWEAWDPGDYERLPFNAGGAYDVLVFGGHVVLPGASAMRADVAINYDEPVARSGGRVREVGDLSGAVALDTIRIEGGFLHPRTEALERSGSAVWLRLGARAQFDIREGPSPTSALRRRIE